MKTRTNRWARGAMALFLSLLVAGGGLFVTTLAFAEDVEVEADGNDGNDVEVNNVEVQVSDVDDDGVEAQSYGDTVATVETKAGIQPYGDFKTAWEAWYSAEGSTTLMVKRALDSSDLLGLVDNKEAIGLPFDDYSGDEKKTLNLGGFELPATINLHATYSGASENFRPLLFVLENGTLSGALRIANQSNWGGVNAILMNNIRVDGGVYVPNTYTDQITEKHVNILTLAEDCGTKEDYGTIGGVYVGAGSTFTMNGGTITNGKKLVNVNGQGVFLGESAEFTMNDGTITGNVTDQNGGGVYMAANAKITMQNGIISNNKAAIGGGVYAEGPYENNWTSPVEDVFTMTGGTISGNSATSKAGGVYVKGYKSEDYSATGRLSITNGVISNNAADTDGGGVYVAANASFTMKGGTIGGDKAETGNQAENGGGIYVAKWAKLTMEDGAISYNTATTGNGGGVYVVGADYDSASDFDYSTAFDLTSGTIMNNEAAGNGGGVYFMGGSQYTPLSGSQKPYYGVFTMAASTIGDNTAANGGGVYVARGQFTMSNVESVISGNKAKEADAATNDEISGQEANTTEYNGGGVYVAQTAKLTMTGGAISSNTATTNGGGVYVVGADYDSTSDSDYSTAFELNSGTIMNNKATGNGGGVYFKGGAKEESDYYGQFTMVASTIGDNTAANGGGVYVARGQFTVNDYDEVKSVISNNTATTGDGGGVFIMGSAEDKSIFSITGGVIGGNTATCQGGGVYVGANADFAMTDSIIGRVESEAHTNAVGENENAEGSEVSNQAMSGGGVFVDANANCTMSSGKIMNNAATTNGGGVYVTAGSTFTISDTPMIKSNKGADKFNNVYLPKTTGTGGDVSTLITVDGDLDVNTTVGVTTELVPTKDNPAVQFTTGYQNETYPSDPCNYFKSDVESNADGTQKYFVCWVDGHVTEGVPNKEAAIHVHVHNWTYAPEIGKPEITATCNALGVEHGACLDPESTDPITLTATLEAKDKTYDGKTVEETKDVKVALPVQWTEDNDLIIPEISYYEEEDENALSDAPKDVGNYTAKATVTKKVEGQEAQVLASVSKPFSITPLEADLAWANTSLTYNGKEQQPTATVSNIVSGDTCTVTVTGAQTKVGTYTAEATDLSNPNYELPANSTTSFTIAPLEAKLAWANTYFVYDGAEHMPTATVSNVVKGDTCAVSVTGKQSKAGTHEAKATSLSNPNYKLPADPTAQFTIGSTSVTYSAHVQTYGDVPEVSNGQTCGTTGKAKRLEAIKVRVNEGTIEYRSHVQSKGWESTWAKDGAQSGTTGKGKRIEAIQMRLSGAEGQHVWYRVHSQTYGWLGWAKDGEVAGTTGLSKRVEAYEVVVLPDGQVPDGYVEGQASYIGAVVGNAHVQGSGWQGKKSGIEFGTIGKGKRIEAFKLSLRSEPASGGIEYSAHVQSKGWTGTKKDGQLAGTTGKGKRIEAVKINLTGDVADECSVWYRVHSQTYGWLGWAHDGEEAGTTGLSKRAEAIDVQVLPKGQVPAGYDAGKAALRSK